MNRFVDKESDDAAFNEVSLPGISKGDLK